MVLRAVCVTKFPTLTFADNSRFRGMLGDLFPGATISDATNPELEAAVKEAAAAMKLELTQQQASVWVNPQLIWLQSGYNYYR